MACRSQEPPYRLVRRSSALSFRWAPGRSEAVNAPGKRCQTVQNLYDQTANLLQVLCGDYVPAIRIVRAPDRPTNGHRRGIA